VDYIFRWLELEFDSEEESPEDLAPYADPEEITPTGNSCPDCGTETVKQATCEFCTNCSWTGGCG